MADTVFMVKSAFLALCLATAACSQASTVTLSSTYYGPAAFNATNTAKVANGSLIRVGMVTDLANPAASFVEFGTSTVKNAGAGSNLVPGKIAGTVTQSQPETGHDVINQQTVYLWVYNAATAGAATQQGLFKTTQSFPVNQPTWIDDYVTIQSAVDITGVVSIPGFAPARILPGDATDSLHFVLGASIPVPPDSDADGLPDAWESSNGLNPSNPADAVLDPDGDSFDNRLEHAIGADPRSPTYSGLPVQGKLQVNGIEYGTFKFTRLKNLTGSTLIPEMCTTLNPADWQSGASVFTTVSVTDQGSTESILLRDIQPLSSRRCLFFRLRLTVP